MKNKRPEGNKSLKLKSLENLDLSSIFENTKDSVWAINTEYEIIYTNHIFSEDFQASFGVSIAPGSNLLHALPEPLRPTWKKRYDRVFNNESFSLIDQVDTAVGLFYIEVFLNPIVVEELVVGAMFFGKNITARRQSELDLLKSKLLLQSCLESQIDTILFALDTRYRYLYFNTAHLKGMKYFYGQDIQNDESILNFITNKKDRERSKEYFDRALAGESLSIISEFGNEHIGYFESFFNPIYNEKKEIIGSTGLARDITKRKKVETALIESEKQQKELNATKDRLFSIIGHDLRSPFNSIMGLSDLLLENLHDPDFTESENYLRFIRTSAHNTLALLDNLLNWAKMQTGQLMVEKEILELSSVVNEIIRLKKTIAEAKNISLNYYSHDDIRIYADENMLKTILRNLVSNAIKFTPNGGEIQLTAQEEELLIRIEVSDTGIGMEQGKVEKLFDPAHLNKKSFNDQSSGLGLLLCKEFVEKHNGSIWAKSSKGLGSTFIFTIAK